MAMEPFTLYRMSKYAWGGDEIETVQAVGETECFWVIPNKYRKKPERVSKDASGWVRTPQEAVAAFIRRKTHRLESAEQSVVSATEMLADARRQARQAELLAEFCGVETETKP